jgi:signal transduction histidine kinase
MEIISQFDTGIFMRQGNSTILAVDDNDALRYSLLRTLEAGGYSVIEARTGAEALKMADHSPDLITLDVRLPDFDGFEVCRRLKANPKTAHIPVLHISSTFTASEYRVRGLESADGYLAEPVSREELLATVGALLRLKKAEREARLHAEAAEKARMELSLAHAELEERVQERTRELDGKTKAIHVLSTQLLRLQDDERRRLARELHDSTGQMLAAMKMSLAEMTSEAKGRKISALVDRTIAINDEMSSQLRTMSYLLHPPLLDEMGLPSALRWYLEGFSQRSGIEVDLEVSEQFGRLPDDMEIAVFRVIQEGLTNIHRHSGSSTAKVQLSRFPKEIKVEVIDSGKGIPANQFNSGKLVPGVGMMGMQERMRHFGGSAEITSSEKGTIVVATIPVEESAAEVS